MHMAERKFKAEPMSTRFGPRGAIDARSLLALPMEERERLLMRAAAAIADEYEAGGRLAGLEMLSWEDHFDAPVLISGTPPTG